MEIQVLIQSLMHFIILCGNIHEQGKNVMFICIEMYYTVPALMQQFAYYSY